MYNIIDSVLADQSGMLIAQIHVYGFLDGTHIFFDDYFNSPELLLRMKKNQHYVKGTIHGLKFKLSGRGSFDMLKIILFTNGWITVWLY